MGANERGAGRKPSGETGRSADAIEALRREAAVRRRGYRERALRILPHVCASCGRTFSGPRLRELTVHHKNHDHEHNPPDGSNWELLCLYCHDHEHEKLGDARARGAGAAPSAWSPAGFDALADLDKKLGQPPRET